MTQRDEDEDEELASFRSAVTSSDEGVQAYWVAGAFIAGGLGLYLAFSSDEWVAAFGTIAMLIAGPIPIWFGGVRATWLGVRAARPALTQTRGLFARCGIVFRVMRTAPLSRERIALGALFLVATWYSARHVVIAFVGR